GVQTCALPIWDPGRALPPVISRRRLNPTYEGGGSCSVWKAKLIGMCRISGSGSRIGRASTNLTDHNRWPSSSMSFSLWSNNVVSSAAICRASANPPRPLVHTRSEEHTSELQSRENLVCRLLLEKKKKTRNHDICILKYTI